MCDFGSHYFNTRTGEIRFLVDADVVRIMDENEGRYEFLDLCGHRGIELRYPEVEFSHSNWTEKERFPVPLVMVNAVREGRMRRMLDAYGIVEVHLDDNGELHNDDGPAIVEKAWGNGLAMKYRAHGKPYRKSGPTDVEYFENGELRCELYYDEDELLHNENGPARMEKEEGEEGYYTFEYYIRGQRSRAGAPAGLVFTPKRESWYIDGWYHRPPENGPAVRIEYESGESYCEWCENNIHVRSECISKPKE